MCCVQGLVSATLVLQQAAIPVPRDASQHVMKTHKLRLHSACSEVSISLSLYLSVDIQISLSLSLCIYIYIYTCMKHIAIPYTLKANQEFLTHMVQETAGFVQHSQVLQGVRTQFDHIR
jgi:hypothetical protein